MYILDPKPYTLIKILSVDRYHIPKYQRDYSWTKEQWEDLWFDIEEVLDSTTKDEQHYLGYLFLQEPEDELEELKIIDGQQRLTTLSVLICSAISLLNDLSRGDLVEEYKNKYLIRKNSTILKLNKNNNDAYAGHLVNAEEVPYYLIDENDSNSLLNSAHRYFKKEISEKYANNTGEITNFIDEVSEKLIFTLIKVSTAANAYKLFQTLNDRGMQLAIADLLKNHLYSIVDNDDVDNDEENTDLQLVENNWDKLLKTIKSNRLSYYLKVEWNRKHKKFRREKELFKVISQEVNDVASVHKYLNMLIDDSHLFRKLTAATIPKDFEFESNTYANISMELLENCLSCMKTFGVKSPIGLIMTVIENAKSLGKDNVNHILNCISVITVRYNGIGKGQANKQEIGYNQLAYLIHKGQKFNLENILGPMYFDNGLFKHDFSYAMISQKKRAEFIMIELAEFLHQEYYEGDISYLRHNMDLQDFVDHYDSKVNFVELLSDHKKFLADVAVQKWKIDW